MILCANNREFLSFLIHQTRRYCYKVITKFRRIPWIGWNNFGRDRLRSNDRTNIFFPPRFDPVSILFRNMATCHLDILWVYVFLRGKGWIPFGIQIDFRSFKFFHRVMGRVILHELGSKIVCFYQVCTLLCDRLWCEVEIDCRVHKGLVQMNACKIAL